MNSQKRLSLVKGMADAFDRAWDLIKMGKEHDDEERRLIQHIVSMAMGLNDEEEHDGGYLEGLAASGKKLSDLVTQRFGETGGAEGGYMTEGDPARHIENIIEGGGGFPGLSQEEYDKLELQSESEEDMDRRLLEQFGAYTPRPSDYYRAPQIARGDMAKILQMLQENPMVWAETGTGPEGAYTNLFGERPNEDKMFHRWNTDEWAEEGWTPMDKEGPFDDKLWMTRHDEKKPWGEGGFDFHDHDSDERGSVGQIDLVEALMRLINEGKSHL